MKVSVDNMLPLLLADSEKFLNIVKLSYLHKKSSDFDEIWYTTAHLKLYDSRVTEY